MSLLVRGSSLAASMPQYLISRVSNLGNVDVKTKTEMIDVESDGRLRDLIVSSHGSVSRLPVDSLFVCIGGEPRTEGVVQIGLSFDEAGYVRTGVELSSAPGALDRWPLERHPLPLETSWPGLFAAGDVRSRSIKRCAAAIGEGSMAVSLIHQRLAETDGQ